MHPIENIMQTAMSKIKEIVDVNTIVGDPVISADGSTIIPITQGELCIRRGRRRIRQRSGVLSGRWRRRYPFAGGASSGISITLWDSSW